jgi:chemotaxis protein MotB
VAVEQFLNKSGVAEQRMGVAGYGPYQPIAANRSDADRQKNRRVEIYVLSPDAAIAGRSDKRFY